ncbi:four helix bundle protein [Zeaxanthinibacter sp. PT1]|uniref:four helix bundle protein n=1 Tax=Zeaxanthinibacter TaxID=561554 RepID=UPI0023496F66|nr:four helix bundle protein [Zeaxanthinibacter sp. PT1]MDC6352357.1 four helix bundle protein [Zeaxanthinibacter sp. PT1]
MKNSVSCFEDLEVWRISRKLNVLLDNLIKNSQLKYDQVLRHQIERSAGSVMDNIAEGFGREGTKELIHFLSIAKGSCEEFRSQLYRALDKGYVEINVFNEMNGLALQESKKLHAFMKYLRKSNIRGQKFK